MALPHRSIDDGFKWSPAVDQSGSTETSKDRNHDAPAGTVGRFVRVTFTGTPAGKPAALAEFSATAMLEK